MNMLLEELQALAADPRSWAVVAVMLFVSGRSFFVMLWCPHVRGVSNISDDQVAQAQSNPFEPGMRFGFMMVIGIALTVLGLFMIASGTQPTLALAALVAGIVAVQTEPARLRIRESKQRLIARRDAAADVLAIERDRLSGSHRELAITNFLIMAALIMALMSF